MSRRPGRIWLTLAVAVVTAGAGVVIIDHQARGDSSTAVAGGADEPAAPDLSPRWWDGSSIRVPSMDSFGLAAAARRPAVVQLAAVQELTSPAALPASSRPSVTAAVAPTVVQAPSAAPEVAPKAIDRAPAPADPPAASDSIANAMVETSSPTTAAAVPATVPQSPPDQAPSPTSVPAPTATPPPADLPEAGPTRGKSADHIPDQANGGSGNPDRPAPRTPEPATSG